MASRTRERWVRILRTRVRRPFTPRAITDIERRIDRAHRARLLPCKIEWVDRQTLRVRIPHARPVPLAWLQESRFALRLDIAAAPIACRLTAITVDGDAHVCTLEPRNWYAAWAIRRCLRIRPGTNQTNAMGLTVDTACGARVGLPNILYDRDAEATPDAPTSA